MLFMFNPDCRTFLRYSLISQFATIIQVRGKTGDISTTSQSQLPLRVPAGFVCVRREPLVQGRRHAGAGRLPAIRRPGSGAPRGRCAPCAPNRASRRAGPFAVLSGRRLRGGQTYRLQLALTSVLDAFAVGTNRLAGTAVCDARRPAAPPNSEALCTGRPSPDRLRGSGLGCCRCWRPPSTGRPVEGPPPKPSRPGGRPGPVTPRRAPAPWWSSPAVLRREIPRWIECFPACFRLPT
jgi:hypothetical protein